MTGQARDEEEEEGAMATASRVVGDRQAFRKNIWSATS